MSSDFMAAVTIHSDFRAQQEEICDYFHLFPFFLPCSKGAGNGTPLQYSCLENPMDGGAWWAAVHGVVKSQTQLSDFTFTFYFHALEKEMATHSSVLAWRIPGTGEPGGLPSLGLHRVGHDWSNLAAAAAAMGPNAVIFAFLIFHFKLALSLSSFTLIKRLFSSLQSLPFGWYPPHIKVVDVSPTCFDSSL